MTNEGNIITNDSTEQKIKEAARKVFTEKGFAATRTRDIAEASGYNLALINYYFRSKENLFNIIMIESLQLFVGSILPILNDRETTLMQKVETMVDHYIDMLIANPNIPFFVMNAVNTNPHELMARVAGQNAIGSTYLEEQWRELIKKKKALAFNPMHLFINMIGMTVFPFVAAPMIKARNKISNEAYIQMMLERKKLIPIWMKSMFETI
jgi:AcrR family transcriptional regulator